MSPLAVNRAEMAAFIDALFRYVDEGTYVQLRAFYDRPANGSGGTGAWGAWQVVKISAGLGELVDAAVRFAQACADAPQPVVFCPPVVTLNSATQAAEKNTANGPILSVECDQAASAARELLERLLGPATIVVASGGEWTCPVTGTIEPKLHLHWRLQEPTRQFVDHQRLKEARRLAQQLAGADGSAVPLVHPLRWPGSWHRKGEPRLARIAALNDGAEIDLGDALERLREAVDARGGDTSGADYSNRQAGDPEANFFDVAAALAVIPNNDLEWNEWNRIGLAIWAASSGSDAGFAAFDAWSQKSIKYDRGTTRERWTHISKHPPDRIGFGTLNYLAKQARPGWRKPSWDFVTPPRWGGPFGDRGNKHQQPGGNGAGEDDATGDQDQGEAHSRGAAGTPPPEEDFDAPPPDSAVREFPVMAEEAFIGLPGEIVRMVAPHTESDPAGLLLSALTMFGNCLGRGPHYRVEASDHGPNLFVLKVGDSSKARKGTGEDRVLAFFRHVDEEWMRRRVHTGLSSGEGVLWEVRDPIVKTVTDKKSGTTMQEVADAGVDDKRLMIIESEFAGALRVMQREGNILSRILRDAWDRGNLATLTKNSPARATAALISIVGHITAPELRTYFDRTEMANGFGNRFLFACVRRSKFLPFGGNLDDGAVSMMAYRIRRAVYDARNIGRVTMSPATADAWQQIYADLSADRPGLLGSLTARSEAQVVRIAMLYALLAGAAMIEIEHLMAAVAIEQFCRDSVEYIFADMLGDPVADTILDALRAAGTNGLTRTEISNLFSRNTSASQIARALGELARRGLAAQRRADSSGQGGRPPEIWVAVAAGAL